MEIEKPSMLNRLAAEFMGTFILVFIALGAILSASVVSGGELGYAELVGIALAFGIALYAGVHTLGSISGGHFNPAVSLGMSVVGRLPWKHLPGYVLVQLAGATAASALLFMLGGGVAADFAFTATRIGTLGTTSALISEIALTFLFMYIILTATSKGRDPKLAAFPIGLYLAAAILVGAPFSGPSLNPARSFGPALFAGGEALSELWLYAVGPVVGVLLAILIWKLVEPKAKIKA
jgi:aquaporin Z